MSRLIPATVDPAVERRTRILDAAERCFVAHGFHRTTMQDIALAAQMSVGNLYRYFEAKDAVVLGLAERDRAQFARHLPERQDELWPTLVKLLRLHLVEKPREKAVLLVEIWAEGTRNPRIGAMLARFQGENATWVAAALRSTGCLSDSEIGTLGDLIRVHSQGIVIDRALSADHDPVPAFDRLIAMLEDRISARASGVRGVACLEAVQ